MRGTARIVVIVLGLVASAMLLFLLVVVPGMADVATPSPVAGTGSSPGSSAGSGADPGSNAAPGAGGATGQAQATLLTDVPVRAAPDGPTLKETPTEDFPVIIYAGNRVTVLGTDVGLTGQWVRVYVLPSQSSWPSDIYAWIPVAQDGRPVLDVSPAAECPAELTLAALATLSPHDRLRCAGSGEFVLEGHTTFNGDTLGYNVSPAFFGSRDVPTSVGLSADPQAGPAAWPGGQHDQRLPITPALGVEAIPIDTDIVATGQFDVPEAADCRRAQPDSTGVVPPEAAADSADWCRTRFIVTRWELVNGPEGRPPVAGEIQLHRHPGSNACAGVGMPPLTLHIDLAAADQVWLTAAGFPRPILASFSGVFTAVPNPVPSIVDGNGLVMTDGMTIDPDTDIGGHMVCPTGDIVYFG